MTFQLFSREAHCNRMDLLEVTVATEEFEFCSFQQLALAPGAWWANGAWCFGKDITIYGGGGFPKNGGVLPQQQPMGFFSYQSKWSIFGVCFLGVPPFKETPHI